MIVSPAIIALLGGGLLVVGFAIYAAMTGLRIVHCWDLASGSALQLDLERRTYLVSTILTVVMLFEIFSLFLFVYTADHLHPLFAGAMCAAGTLNVNGYGYPLLVVKIFSVLGCGIWLIVNQADNQAEDYPLIRFKYRLLFAVTALLAVGALLQTLYFKGLAANVITSCCGTLFSAGADNLAGEIAALPFGTTRLLFFLAAALHVRTALHLLVTGRGGRLFGWFSAAYFAAALVAVISFISVYYYELPTHHCPFDLLQGGYHFIGYPLYATLFTFGITGMAAGLLDRFTALPSLARRLPALQRRYAWISLTGGLLFLGLALYPMIFGDFRLS